MIHKQGLHTTQADNNSVKQRLYSVPKPRFVMKTHARIGTELMKPRDAMRLSSDCFGKIFKALSGSKTIGNRYNKNIVAKSL